MLERHRAFQALPVVDVAPLRSSSPQERRQAASELFRAARDAGFLYVTGHGVPERDIQRLLAQAKALFALPFERKMELYIGLSRCHRGYVPPGEEVFYGGGRDLKEAFDLALDLPEDDPDVRAGNPLLGPNVWPALPGFRDDVSAYYARVFELGRTLLRGFALGLGLGETYFDRFVKKPPSQLRLIHYPKSDGGERALGIAAHTDYECFTILLPTAPGLEVMNGAGEWIDASPIDGALIVNIGDMLEIFSNGELLATSHRVRSVDVERYAFPLFFACDYHTVVAPLPELTSAERPARYEPLVAGEHLFAQTAQSFTYLKRRIANGELRLPNGARPLSSFGREARLLRARAS